jgi:hypothetical protein
MIITPKEFVRLHLESWANAARQKYRRAIRPIYAAGKNGKPVYVGTSFFLNIFDSTYIVTAAHVVDEAKNVGLYVAGVGGFVPVKGVFHCSTSPTGKRADDHFDFAWARVPGAYIMRIGDVVPITEQDISKNRVATTGRVYVALGYPRSKNKKVNPISKRITPKFARYYSTGKPFQELFKSLNLSGNEHIAIGYGTQSVDSDGNKDNSFHPRGLSGGPLIDLGKAVSREDLQRTTPFEGVLAGMIIEKYDDHEALVSVKIDAILESIKNARAQRAWRGPVGRANGARAMPARRN